MSNLVEITRGECFEDGIPYHTTKNSLVTARIPDPFKQIVNFMGSPVRYASFSREKLQETVYAEKTDIYKHRCLLKNILT